MRTSGRELQFRRLAGLCSEPSIGTKLMSTKPTFGFGVPDVTDTGTFKLERGYRFVVLAYVASLPWETFELPLATPVQLAGAVLFGSVALASLRGVRFPRISRVQTLLLGSLAVWSFATVLWSAAPSVSLLSAVSVLTLCLSSVVVAKTSGSIVLDSCQALGLSCLLLAVPVYFATPEEGYDGLTIDGIDQNIMAFNLALGVAAALYAATNSTRRPVRYGFWIATLVIAGAVLLTGSRTGLGSLFFMVVMALVVTAGQRRWVSLLTIPIGVFMVATYLIDSDRLPARLRVFVASPEINDHRVLIIDSFQRFQSEWDIWGIGIGADADFLQAQTGVYRNAHSAFWKIWIETGFVGLVLWAVLAVVLVMAARHSPARRFLLLAACVVVPFLYTLGPIHSNVLWWVIGLAMIPDLSQRVARPATLRAAQRKVGHHTAPLARGGAPVSARPIRSGGVPSFPAAGTRRLLDSAATLRNGGFNVSL